MTKAALKKKIYSFVENTNDDKLLEAVYTILNGHSNNDFELSTEDIKLINQRRKAILNGKEKTYSVA